MRLLNTRMNKALKNVDQIGKLANKSAYNFDQNDVDKFVGALKSKVDKLDASFNSVLAGKTTEKETEWTL